MCDHKESRPKHTLESVEVRDSPHVPANRSFVQSSLLTRDSCISLFATMLIIAGFVSAISCNHGIPQVTGINL